MLGNLFKLTHNYYYYYAKIEQRNVFPTGNILFNIRCSKNGFLLSESGI